MTLPSTDPRHGTVAGHVAGCRRECCRTARSAYDKRRKYAAHTGTPYSIDNTGTLRRLRALQALGWTTPRLARELGVSAKTLHAQLYYGRTNIHSTTATLIAEGYERLAMTKPTGHYADEMRRRAKVNGWASPLAWDDIDKDPEPPTATPCRVDPVVIDRIIGGDIALARSVTADERRLVCQRWPGSLQELERLTGWNVWRERRAA